MSDSARFPLVAVDVGNSRMKLGFFDGAHAEFPEPVTALALDADAQLSEIAAWLAGRATPHRWVIASVERVATERLVAWLARSATKPKMLTASDLPLEVRLPKPDLVGIDRLVNAVAVNRLREPTRAGIVIDLGSAITVDVIGEDGAFLGGAIMPGMAMSARALHEFTHLLPLVPVAQLSQAPDPLGKSTTAALESGLFWGRLGAVRELAAQLANKFANPQIFVTGGGASSLAGLLRDAAGAPARHVEHLTLGGIALSVSQHD